MSLSPRVRFAPSPTGFLHVGNARTALYNWLLARKLGGKFILRIEDTDAERSSDEFTQAILDDLEWLGLNWDEGPDCGGPHEPYLQSKRTHYYRLEVAKMEKSGHAYPCYCTPEELKARREEALAQGRPPKYDNRCRNLTELQKSDFEKAGRRPVWRFKIPEGMQIRFHDIVRGDVSFESDTIGDFVIVKADGGPTFHLSVVIDDALMGVTHVIRGEDHLPNTPKHILLFKTMGHEPPQFAHLPMILGKDHTPLSKRHGDTSVREYRNHGYLPEALNNYLALLGWAPNDNREIFTAKELVQAFALERVNKAPAVFDFDKLGWVSAQHMSNKSVDEIYIGATPFLEKENIFDLKNDEWKIKKAIETNRAGLRLFSEVPKKIEPFFKHQFDIEDPAALEVLRKPTVVKLVQRLIEKFQSLPNDNVSLENLQSISKDLQTELNLKGKEYYQPFRLAVSGSLNGPELVLFAVVGRDKIVERLKNTFDKYCRS